jgi:hypothetical protein
MHGMKSIKLVKSNSAEQFILEKLIVLQIYKKFFTFTGLEGSLPHVQEPAIFRCPEADE